MPWILACDPSFSFSKPGGLHGKNLYIFRNKGKVYLVKTLLLRETYRLGKNCKGAKTMQHKRSPISIDQSSLSSLTAKRQKTSTSLSSKERKEKIGERVMALQQLVSPFGKTDTASVLLEAMDYISFLHEQVKVLSAPYLHSTSARNMQESESYNLRSKGLCIVPVSCTAGVAGTNGADIWAPIKTSSPKF